MKYDELVKRLKKRQKMPVEELPGWAIRCEPDASLGNIISVRTRADKTLVISGYAMLWDTPDRHMTVFERGCVANLSKNMEKISARAIPVLFNHEKYNFLGKVTEAVEDDKGLLVTALITSTDWEGQEAVKHLLAGTISHFSIGFRPIEARAIEAENLDGDPITSYTLIELLEVSVVRSPSQLGAVIDAVEEKGKISGEDNGTDDSGIGDRPAETRKNPNQLPSAQIRADLMDMLKNPLLDEFSPEKFMLRAGDLLEEIEQLQADDSSDRTRFYFPPSNALLARIEDVKGRSAAQLSQETSLTLAEAENFLSTGDTSKIPPSALVRYFPATWKHYRKTREKSCGSRCSCRKESPSPAVEEEPALPPEAVYRIWEKLSALQTDSQTRFKNG
jgi:HK97 family phage prohead protease